MVEYSSEDDESHYEAARCASPATTARSEYRMKTTHHRRGPPVTQGELYHHRSYQNASTADPDDFIMENHLNTPQYHQRSPRRGALPETYVGATKSFQAASREPSRERIKYYPPDLSSDEGYRPSRGYRSRRKSRSRGEADYIDPERARNLEKLELLEEQKESNLDPIIVERLARLKELEEEESRNEEEAAFLARLDERKRKEKPIEEAPLLQYQYREYRRGEPERQKEKEDFQQKVKERFMQAGKFHSIKLLRKVLIHE